MIDGWTCIGSASAWAKSELFYHTRGTVRGYRSKRVCE